MQVNKIVLEVCNRRKELGEWMWYVDLARRASVATSRTATRREFYFIFLFFSCFVHTRRQVESASWDGLGALHRDLTKKEKTSAKNFLLVEERDRASEIRKRRRRAQERGKNEKVTSSQSSRNLKKNRFSPGSKKKINRLKCP